MDDETLNKQFEIAFEEASKMTVDLPPDVMLKFYAYYKQAIQEEPKILNFNFENNDLRSAFKLNALMQIGNMSSQDAKLAYIELLEQIKNKYKL